LSDHIVAPSRQVADTLARIAHVPRRKIDVVHHGFDLDRFDPARINQMAVRRELGLGERLVFGAIGRLYELKNYPALVTAFASAMADIPEAMLVIVGAGDGGAVRSLASVLGVSDRVLVCGPRSDIPQVLGGFDVFVHPAIAESFGMVIIEAMAMARPVLTTPVGIAPEVIEPRRTGVLAKASSPEALEIGLREMVALRPHWKEMGAAARRRVQGFTATRMAWRYAELYETWLGSQGGTY
jgi:glycosyltransferase involved in cell wall biosynthesis